MTGGLRVEGLACRRGGRLVFSDISFELAPGQAICLRGRNGVGKSSLLRVLAGLTPPAAGAVTRPAGGMAWLGHENAVKPVLTAAANLSHWGVAPGALGRVGLAGLADLPARFLSAGQRRRLALARVAGSGRPLWLLDEPETALDAESRARLIGLIEDHLAAGGLAVVASHGLAGLGHVLEMGT